MFSGLFAPMYHCKKCGDVWHVTKIESIDYENDDVYINEVCTKCLGDVTPLVHNGIPIMHPLTDEEAYWELGQDDSDYLE